MNYLNSITNNELNTVAGVPFAAQNDRFAHLSVPVGLVCSERRFYDRARNVHISETVCDFDRLARSAQHIPMTRKKKQAKAKKTKRRKN